MYEIFSCILKILVYDARDSFLAMKSLAISVACAIGLASPGFCGDLGRADITSSNQGMSSTSFSANCFGSFDSPSGPECLVEFLDNKLAVDSSEGITSDQIVSVSHNWHPNGYFISVQYNASNGSPSLAQFSFLEKSVAKDFLSTLAHFMSGTMTTPISPEPEAGAQDISEDMIKFQSEDTCTGPSILCF